MADEGIHAHLAYFGSELACKECNPNCYKNHGMGRASWCGDKNCPMKKKIVETEVIDEYHGMASYYRVIKVGASEFKVGTKVKVTIEIIDGGKSQ